ncbi:uncharacterized protein [Dasypus novemcinctus]|uniref:uncharacterized protein isoform X2 n=1 Tax=Dasypus novemcinctus TaxID=9361 RepID=UPI000C836154|nr:uncharacterized protein LOC101414248 [Dasypus novemcinctus]XP_058163641.1 uncharacterized protein LOC101414248 [Dasypus novemcinctus]
MTFHPFGKGVPSSSSSTDMIKDDHEEKWVNSAAGSETPPAKDSHSEEEEEEEAGSKTLLRVPSQESAWGLVAWPRNPRPQAQWWDDDVYFSVPTVPGPCFCGCSLRTKVMLHPRATPAARLAPQSLPSLAPKGKTAFLGTQPQADPQTAPHATALKVRPRLPPKARLQALPRLPSQGRAPARPPQQLAPVTLWPLAVINAPPKRSPLRGRQPPRTLSEKTRCSPSGCDNTLPHLLSK